ncbi:hypothetical protein B0T22DRAFT_482585 [Podospora appendiculata]|uniref:Uncharacterized protein n=1 Tax=Podospora appendiculata TaxID=314037 RepID=A0AAE0X614_9PEZI|nr:hypothetical protein B0T22DRAFT_482585 [Podospora appendiculata]
MPSLINAKNRVPHLQRVYQAAYRGHTRIWKIAPRSNVMLTPFLVLMWGSFAGSMYMMSRKVLGHNTWFGKD